MKSILLLLLNFLIALTIQAQSTSHSANTNNISATQTVAIGNDTGTTGDKNIYIGKNAGTGDPSDESIYIGFSAGQNKVGATDNNVGIGHLALFSINGGTNNVSIGFNAGRDMDSASENLMLGARAGIRNTGSNNVFLGRAAGYQNQGEDNVFIGPNSGVGNAQGSDNIYIGGSAGYANISGTKNVFIGDRAGESETGLSNTLIIESGGGSSTPLIFGDFAGNKVGINTNDLPNYIADQNISNYSLFVKGGLLADEVRVRTDWADYVFKKEYHLQSITELENFIIQNGHLPNCPTEQEVNNQGIEIGNITKIQQEKIEELTLYIIQLEKRLSKIEQHAK